MTTPPPAGPRPALHAFVLLVFLSLWTWKLLEPYPVPEDLREGLAKAGLSFAAAKTLHAAGYAFLAVLAGTLPGSRSRRRALIALLALHGVATEVLQDVLPFNRTGRFYDVLIDWSGIALGLLALRLMKRPV